MSFLKGIFKGRRKPVSKKKSPYKKRLELRASDVSEDLYNRVIKLAKKENRTVPRQVIVMLEAFFKNQ